MINEMYGDVQQPQQVIGEEQIAEAIDLLTKYKNGKGNLEHRVVEDEQWYKIRHWDVIKGKDTTGRAPQPSSAWLFNAILNKHADAMDNYPETVVLPREQSDEMSAKTLSEVLPVIMEYNDFEQTYSDNWWEKLKHGTAPYGVFWNKSKDNGLGDVDIVQIDLLKIFWEPGITDIQDSKNLFIVELTDKSILEQQYPNLKGKLGGDVINVETYCYDDSVDTSDKALVVDWYYKLKNEDGSTKLHYVKFCGREILYASQNDPEYAMRGWYDHGLYPVVFDTMWPEKGTPVGFGYVAVCKDPQLYIDKLSANIMENSLMTSKKRYFVSKATNINKDQFLDWNEPIVDVEGEISDARVKEIVCNDLDSVYLSVLQLKIEEMKETAANRDVNSGGTGSQLTAASAIAALQEAGNKASRDMISASYRAYTQIARLVVELIRQFYDESRAFRITMNNDEYKFIELNNAQMKDQVVGMTDTGECFYRKPIFDLKIKAQKRNPFSKMEQNERAKELYSMGFFNPERAQESLGALDMMEFEGIDKVREQVSQGQTLLNICQQQQQQIQQLMGLIGVATQQSGGTAQKAGASMPENGTDNPKGKDFASGIMQANTPMTSYGQRLAERSKVSMND